MADNKFYKEVRGLFLSAPVVHHTYPYYNNFHIVIIYLMGVIYLPISSIRMLAH